MAISAQWIFFNPLLLIVLLSDLNSRQVSAQTISPDNTSITAIPSVSSPARTLSAPVEKRESIQESGVRVLLSPRYEAQLSSQMNGRIIDIRVEEGDAFKKGDILVEFDCRKQQAVLQTSAAELVMAEKNYQVQQQLADMQAASKLDVALAVAEVDKAEATRSLNEVLVSQCLIHAPYDGWVVEKHANHFENVVFGDPLLSIVDKSPLLLDLFVPSHWLSWLKTGWPFTLLIDETGRQYQARVYRLPARVDAASQTIAIKARFENIQDQYGLQDQHSIQGQDSIQGQHSIQGQLLPGMSGTARFSSIRVNAP